jgi:hypothetical protein
MISLIELVFAVAAVEGLVSSLSLFELQVLESFVIPDGSLLLLGLPPILMSVDVFYYCCYANIINKIISIFLI